jgi:23S rRNA maturation-related 3'-5' exoribonuclease YhaM
VKNPENPDELLKRLPEIKRIQPKKLQHETQRIFLEDCPSYFWSKPASSTGKYHPKDQAGEHGLWLHTQRAFTAYERLADSYENAGRINKHERECGKAAILLHDIFKYGRPPEDSAHTVSDHDRIAYRYLKTNSELPNDVLGCIDSHNGPWGEGKEPETELEQLHHTADMIASDRNGYFKILEPHPRIKRILHSPGCER